MNRATIVGVPLQRQQRSDLLSASKSSESLGCMGDRIIRGIFSQTLRGLVLLMTTLGCQPDVEECSVPGIGVGLCCILNLPNGSAELGVCRDGRCQNQRYVVAESRCGIGPPLDVVEDKGVHGDLDMKPAGDAERDVEMFDVGLEIGGDTSSCDMVQCASTELCRETDGRCVPRSFGRPGGACDRHSDCASGICRVSEWAEGTASGYCEQACEVDLECMGGICAGSAERVCRRPCGGEAHCPHGWLCRDDEERSFCAPDCRIQGCQGQDRCDGLTGACEQGGQCRYPCRTGESCEHGRCIRPNGTCLTDYHCRSNQFCHAGRCVMDGLTPCQGGVERECSEGQRCIDAGGGTGRCALQCDRDEVCPMHFQCSPRMGVCEARPCRTDGMSNSVFEQCSPGSHGDNLGTCLPTVQPSGSGWRSYDVS